MFVRRSRKRLARPVPQRFTFDELAMLPPAARTAWFPARQQIRSPDNRCDRYSR